MPILDIRGVLLLDAATFLDDTVAGLRYLWATPIVRTVGLGFFAIVAFNGIDDVALVFLATDTLDGGDSAAGLLLAGFAISSAGNLYGSIGVAAALAYLLGRLLIDLTNPRTAFLIGGAGGLVATLAVAAAFRRIARTPSHQ